MNYQDSSSVTTDRIENINSGYIYILINPSMQDMIKVGFTKRTPEERLVELSATTGVPTPFVLIYKEYFQDCVLAEKNIHFILEERGERVASNREFFRTDITTAIKIVQEVKNTTENSNVLEAITDKQQQTELTISKTYLKEGLAYLHGTDTYLIDFEKAVTYLKKAGDLGEAEAFYYLGRLYINSSLSKTFNLDVKQAIAFFEKGSRLQGMYAVYCYAGLGLCYYNKYLAYKNVKNYVPNQKNAAKSWRKFIDQLDFNCNDQVAPQLMREFFIHFYFNKRCDTSLKEDFKEQAIEKSQYCKYELYELESKIENPSEQILQYLYRQFNKRNLNKVASIKHASIQMNSEKETIIALQIGAGYALHNDDIINITKQNNNINRFIKRLIKDGMEVEQLQAGDQGLVVIERLPEEWSTREKENVQLRIIGSKSIRKATVEKIIKAEEVNLECELTNEKVIEIRNKESIFSKMKKWFC